MAVTDQEIQAWLQANSGADDKTIAGAMQQYGLTPEQMARAVGGDLQNITSRYNTALGLTNVVPNNNMSANQQQVTSGQIQDWFKQNPNWTNQQVADTMQQYGVNHNQVSSAMGWNPSQTSNIYNAVVGGNTPLDNAQGVDSATIKDWFNNNPNWANQQVATQMQNYGIGTQQLAESMGWNKEQVDSVYNTVTGQGYQQPSSGLSQSQLQNSLNVSSSTPALSNTDFTVNEIKTAALADRSNPLVRQAMARALQSMNGRGLLNTSMATQAAQEAAIAKALEIAAPDTAAYYNDQRDAKQFGYSSALKDQDYANQLGLNTQQFGFTSALKDQDFNNTTSLTGLQADIQRQRDALLQGYGEYNARLNNDLNIANAQAQYDMKVSDVTQTNYITMIDRIQQDTTKQVQQINSSAMPYEEKQAAIRNIQAQAQAQIDNANRLFKSTNGWQDQWAVAADTYSWQVEGAPEKPASTTTTN